MTTRSSTPTRVAADVAASAAAVAPEENRSFAEQVNYWTRIGMHLERSQSVVQRRVLAVAAGAAQFAGLDSSERATAHALVDARIAERVAKERFGVTSREAGQTTVSIDDDGKLVEISPAGDRRLL